jgi:hypothetical protein
VGVPDGGEDRLPLRDVERDPQDVVALSLDKIIEAAGFAGGHGNRVATLGAARASFIWTSTSYPVGGG